MNNEKVLEMINARIDELGADYNSLSKSFVVLNDSHHNLEIAFTKMETEWKTTKSWFKFLVGTSLLGFVSGLLTVLKTFGLI